MEKLPKLLGFLLCFVLVLILMPSIAQSSHPSTSPAPACSLVLPSDNFSVGGSYSLGVDFNTNISLTGPYTMLGQICVRQGSGYPDCSIDGKSGWTVPVALGTTYRKSWTPPAAGSYQVFCRTSNSVNYECRGDGSFDASSFGDAGSVNNHSCGTNSSRTITVSAPDTTPPTTNFTFNPPTFRPGDTTRITFNAVDTGGSGVKEIRTAIWPGATSCDVNAKSGIANDYIIVQNGGYRDVTVPSCLEYYAIDNANPPNAESNSIARGQGIQLAVIPTDTTKPTTTIDLGKNADQVIARELLNVRFNATYDRPVRAIKIAAAKVSPNTVDIEDARNQAISDPKWSQDESQGGYYRERASSNFTEPIRAPFYMEYYAEGTDGVKEDVHKVLVQAPIAEQTVKVRVAESLEGLNTAPDITFNPASPTVSYKFGSFGVKRIFIRYASNAGNTRDDERNSQGGLPITYSPTPNCTNLAGPDSVYVGQQATFTADYSLSEGTLKGDIVAGSGGGENMSWCGNGACDNFADIGASSGSKSFTWTPTQAGTYDVFCRALNSGPYWIECRGNSSYVSASTSVRSCIGGAGVSTKRVTVLADTQTPTSNLVSTAPENRTGYKKDEQVTVTLMAGDDLGEAVLHTTIWEGVSTKQELLDEASKRGITDLTTWSNPSGIKVYEGYRLNRTTITRTAKAPFYLEYRADDLSGNGEDVTGADMVDAGGGKKGHGVSFPLDTIAPSVPQIETVNPPAEINKGTELVVKVNSQDNQGGVGLGVIHSMVYEGVSSEAELESQMQKKGISNRGDWKNDTGRPAPYLALSSEGIRPAKVPFYMEATAEDLSKSGTKQENGRTIQIGSVSQPNKQGFTHNDSQRPTSNRVSVKSVADPNKTSNFATGELVELTFTGNDNRGVAFYHSFLWEGVATKQQVLDESARRGISVENWQNASGAPGYLAVREGQSRRATVPFYLEYFAVDINDNGEDVPSSADDYVDDQKAETAGGVHFIAVSGPEQTAEVRISENQGSLASCGSSDCIKVTSNFTSPITLPLSAGAGNKTIHFVFIGTKGTQKVGSAVIRKLASDEGVQLGFSPASGNMSVGGSSLAVTLQLNSNVLNLRNYNISGINVKFRVDKSESFISFVPNSSSGLTTLSNVNSNSSGTTIIHYIGYRSGAGSITGNINLGTLNLRPLNSDGTITVSIDEDVQVTSSDVVGSVFVGSRTNGVYTTRQPIDISPTSNLSPTLSPTINLSLTLSPTIPVSLSPTISLTGTSLACDFNKNGRYDESASFGQESDLDIWTKATLGLIPVSGETWNADCTGNDGILDSQANILDLNNWLYLKEGIR